MTKQRLITDFFKSAPKRSQTLITEFFKPITEKKIGFYTSKRDYRKSYAYLKKHKPLSDAIQTHRGYCYQATGNYTEYDVCTTFDKWIKQDNKEVFVPAGTPVATATIDSDSALTHISVTSTFRRQGIGTQLVRFIKKCAPQFHVYAGTEHNSRYRLTEEGAALILACQKKGILAEEQVILDMVPDSLPMY